MNRSMLGIIAVSQRVEQVGEYRERRDALDQRWTAFLGQAGFVPLLLPNHRAAAERLLDVVHVDGVLLTGGNDLVQCGGTAPERDETERWLLEWALHHGQPLIGVCRGMQVIQAYFGARLVPVVGHVTPRLAVVGAGGEREVNSYHCWGTRETPEPLQTMASALDGVVKGVRHPGEKLQGIMWHPERETPFNPIDIDWLRSSFAARETFQGGSRA